MVEKETNTKFKEGDIVVCEFFNAITGESAGYLKCLIKGYMKEFTEHRNDGQEYYSILMNCDENTPFFAGSDGLELISNDNMLLGKVKTVPQIFPTHASDIVRMIADALDFPVYMEDGKLSAYGGNAIRIANYRADLQKWVDKNTWNAPIRLDIVIEDKPTEAQTQVKKGYNFDVIEYIHKTGDIDSEKTKIIASDIKKVINGSPYANTVGGKKINIVATNKEENG